MSEFQRLITEAVRQAMAREDQIIWTAFEQALFTGTHGVKVVRRSGLLVPAAPDPTVPYGQIHEHHQNKPLGGGNV